MAKSTTHLKIKNLKENHHSGGCLRLTIKGKKKGVLSMSWKEEGVSKYHLFQGPQFLVFRILCQVI